MIHTVGEMREIRERKYERNTEETWRQAEKNDGKHSKGDVEVEDEQRDQTDCKSWQNMNLYEENRQCV